MPARRHLLFSSMPLQGAVCLFILLSSLLLRPQAAAAGRLQSLTPERAKELAWSPTWLKLLHFDRSSGRSEILSNDFFLAPNGRHDPEAELLATLEAHDDPWPEDGNSHARCRFPARYFWLAQQTAQAGHVLEDPRCTKFVQWSLPDRVKSVSLFLISGYMGNPASVFGHSLLKLNAGAADDQVGMFDLTVNYGALVPQDEPVWRYVLNGMGGGYDAGFSDRYFYTQDLVYSRTEFRDIWDYELLLSDEQRNLLLLHVWEVLGKKFAYYFLDKNCAFRLAELLELVIDEPLLDNARLWYAPVETFHRLNEIDEARRRQNLPGLIRSVRFIPSGQRRLHHQFSLLDDQEKEVVQAAVGRRHDASVADVLSRLPKDGWPEALEALLAYYNYRLVAEQPDPSPETRSGKAQALLERLRLPPLAEPPPEVPALDSPATGNRPMLTGLGLGHRSGAGDFLRLRWAAFSQEAIGRNGLEGDELVLLDAAVGLGKAGQGVFADSVDVVRISKLKTGGLPADGESPWSWRLRSGLRSDNGPDDSTCDVFFEWGTGRAWKIGQQLTAWAMTDASAHSVWPHARLRPHLGLLAGQGNVRARLLAGAETSDYEGSAKLVWGAEVQMDLSGQSALLLSGERDAVAAELRWYW